MIKIKEKILFISIVCILVCSLALAEGQQGIQKSGTGIEDIETKNAGQGTGQGLDDNTTIVSAKGTSQGEQGNINNETQEQSQKEENIQIQKQNQTQSKVQSGSYSTENGQQVQVQEQSNNRIQLKSGNASAQTSMEMTQEQTQTGTKLQVKLSNGKDAEIKVMPDTASEKALERLKLNVCSAENNCTIELKEVGEGEQVKAAYEVQVQKQTKLLGLFKTKMQVQAQVDAENGEVIQTKKPWWAFMASESDE